MATIDCGSHFASTWPFDSGYPALLYSGDLLAVDGHSCEIERRVVRFGRGLRRRMPLSAASRGRSPTRVNPTSASCRAHQVRQPCCVMHV